MSNNKSESKQTTSIFYKRKEIMQERRKRRKREGEREREGEKIRNKETTGACNDEKEGKKEKKGRTA